MLPKNTKLAKSFKKVAGKNKWHYSCYIVILVLPLLQKVRDHQKPLLESRSLAFGLDVLSSKTCKYLI